MSKERKTLKDSQTCFSRLHYNLGGKYLTDFDSVQSTNGVIFDCENKTYSQYEYKHNTPTASNFIEVKYKLSPYLISMIKKERKTDSQTMFFANLTKEVNANRKEEDLVHFYLVIETDGELPIYVINVYLTENNEVEYKHIKTINNETEFNKFFK